jgi:hypothetical protein
MTGRQEGKTRKVKPVNYMKSSWHNSSSKALRIIDFDSDAFDITSNNCASKTSAPYLSYLYEAVTIEIVVLNGVGRKSKVDPDRIYLMTLACYWPQPSRRLVTSF